MLSSFIDHWNKESSARLRRIDAVPLDNYVRPAAALAAASRLMGTTVEQTFAALRQESEELQRLQVLNRSRLRRPARRCCRPRRAPGRSQPKFALRGRRPQRNNGSAAFSSRRAAPRCFILCTLGGSEGLGRELRAGRGGGGWAGRGGGAGERGRRSRARLRHRRRNVRRAAPRRAEVTGTGRR